MPVHGSPESDPESPPAPSTDRLASPARDWPVNGLVDSGKAKARRPRRGPPVRSLAGRSRRPLSPRYPPAVSPRLLARGDARPHRAPMHLARIEGCGPWPVASQPCHIAIAEQRADDEAVRPFPRRLMARPRAPYGTARGLSGTALRAPWRGDITGQNTPCGGPERLAIAMVRPHGPLRRAEGARLAVFRSVMSHPRAARFHVQASRRDRHSHRATRGTWLSAG